MSTIEKNLYKRVTVKNAAQNSATTQGNSYRGFSTIDISKDSYALYDLDIIKQDIINHFHIRQGEKLSDPEFGTIIWDILFEPFTDDVKEAVIQNVTEIINYDPRVGVNSITVTPYEFGLQIEADLTYIAFDISETLRFKFDQAAGLI